MHLLIQSLKSPILSVITDCNNSKWLTSETAKKITDVHYSLKIVSLVLLMLIYTAVLSFPHSSPAYFIPVGSVVDVSDFQKT